jgi:hypothetical protein
MKALRTLSKNEITYIKQAVDNINNCDDPDILKNHKRIFLLLLDYIEDKIEILS